MLRKEHVLLLESERTKMVLQNPVGALKLHHAGTRAQQAPCQTVMVAQTGEKMSQIA
jgi:hypothetical protein